MKRDRYLFLDLDGVLHPFQAHFSLEEVKAPLRDLQSAGLFVHLELLAEMLKPHPCVRLVVHSSWRYGHTDEELRDLFGPLRGRVVGATSRGLDRERSIIDFALRRHLRPKDYRVLDDQTELFSNLREVLIACDPQLGLSDTQVQGALRAWLDS